MSLKKFFAVIIGLCTAFSSICSFNAGAVDMGDMNGDGNVNSEDALAVLNHVVGNAELSEENQKFADMDGNGNIDSGDALFMLQYCVGLRLSAYEKFKGRYQGYFGDERTESYVAPSKSNPDSKLTINSFKIYLDFDGNTANGRIVIDSVISSEPFEYIFSSDISDSVMNVTQNGSNASINMDFYFSGNEIKGIINKASVLGEPYIFPEVYFEKIN